MDGLCHRRKLYRRSVDHLMKKFQKILSLLLCVVMVFTILPVSATAASNAVAVEHNGETTYYADLQTAFNGFAPSNNTYGGKYVVTLMEDVTGNLNKTLSYPTEVLDITLDLNGHTITGDGTTVAVVFNLGTGNAMGSTITIKDSSGNNAGKITGGKGGVKLDGKNCTLRLEGGTITGNHGASKGGGIFMGATAKLVMTGGVITGNSVKGTASANTGYGGGVLANYADILGGVITGNTAYKGSHLQTGRGGGVCTEVTRTKGYHVLNIADGVVYGNTAENAGDDVMAQGSGMSTVKFALVIGKENWYIDGWNGTKAGSGGGQTDRYNAENPVAYTDGGFTGTVNADGSYAGVSNKTLGLKYVAPAAQPDPTEAPEITTETTAESVIVTATGKGTVKLYKAGEEVSNPCTVARTDAEQMIVFTATAQEEGKAVSEVQTAEVTVPAKEIVRPAQPELPKDNGSNVTDQLITILCDTDQGHTAQTYGWGDPAANIVFPADSQPVWDEELGAWTIGVRIDSIGTYYVWDRFEETCNGIDHEIVKGAPLTSDEYHRIDTTLVWDADEQQWNTLTGKPFEVHTTCQTTPDAPTFFDDLRNYQIKVIGTVGEEELPYFVSLDEESVEIGKVTGSRQDGFTCQVTITLEDGDAYITKWIEMKDPSGKYVYDFEKTTNPIVLTLTYTGDLTAELDGGWSLGITGNTVATAYVTMDAPAAPDKFGDNVTPDLVRVICDADEDHAPLNIKWQSQSTKVRDWVSGVVWSDEYNTWVVPVRIDGIANYYVWLNFEKVYNDILHPLVEGEPEYIDTYLKWDAAKQLWVTLDEKPIEVHVACKTMPDAPSKIPTAQIQVKGDLDHDGIYGENKANSSVGISEIHTTSVPAGGYTLGQVYGSREEGFFIDVTVTLEDGDIYFTNWAEKCANGKTFVYDWDLTQKTVTFTLKYNRSLTGTLYGSNPSDWVGAYTGYKVGEAFVKENIPAPAQQNVTEQLVAVICDSDGDRHETVYGKWYPQHCKTTSNMVWSEELNTWTVDVRIGSLYIMYVDQLEEANHGTEHTLVEDITTVFTSLKWDYDQNLWVPVEPIELHTTCKTVPDAPLYRNQIDGYQIKVNGDMDYDGIFGETTALNNKVKEQWTTSIHEDGYTLSEVYGSREEGFFVDVTVTLADDDAYFTNWINNCAPGMADEFSYDWDKTEQTVTFTLKYNGDLNGTLYGHRYASNTNIDWVLTTTGKDYGVIAEAYLNQKTYPTTLVIYRNGDTSAPYLTVELDELAKGQKLDLTAVEIADYYTASEKYNFYGWYDADLWSKYMAGETVEALEELTASGETVLYAMVKDVYTVTFNTRGGSEVESQEVEHGAVAVQPENPTKTGCFFLAWRTAAAKKYDFATPVTGDLELIAMWGVPGTDDDQQKPDPEPEEDEGCEQDYTCPLIKYSDLRVRAWYHDGVHYCLEKGIMDGIGSGKFAPAEITNRAMIVTILWRLEGKPASEADMTFADVVEGQWYTEAVRWAAENEIVEGYSETAFGPLDTVTREQMAVILYRYAKYKGYDVSAKADLSAYTDADEVSEWAVEAMEWAVGCKLIQGLTTTRLAPSQGTTRAQVATLIYRFATANEKK